jgi:hypothetical protein
VYEVADRFRRECLIEDGSLFTDNELTTLENAEALQAVVGQEDLSDKPFMVKLVSQVEGLTAAQILACAELLLLQLMGENDTGGELKRKHVEELLALVPQRIELPADVVEAIEGGGVASYAAGKNRRDVYLRFLADVVVRLKTLDVEERRATLDDPWNFHAIVLEERTSGNGMQANALLHLLFPETFECVISGTHRAPLLKAFANAPGIADLPDDDRKIRRLHDLTTEQAGWELNFYDEPLRAVWQEKDSAADEFAEWSERLFPREEFLTTERDYKVAFAASLASVAKTLSAGGEWESELRRALTRDKNNFTTWRTNEAFLNWCADEPETAGDALTALWGPYSDDDDWDLPIRNFLAVLPDTAVRGAGTRLSLASVLALGSDAERTPPFKPTVYSKTLGLLGREPAEPDDDESTELATWTDWVNINIELSLRLLARGVLVRDMIDSQSLIYWVAMRDAPEEWDVATRQAFARFRGKQLPDEDGPIEPCANARIPAATPELADRLNLPLDWVQETLDLLAEKKQLILYGPPGTGKTFLAQHIAQHVEASGGRSLLVQFHPSYAYEDFFEGYRPDTDAAGQLSYSLTPGPLRRLASQAQKEPANPHILIVDEINRGNLAKIFGELYFLLEYRDSEIELQYSREPFSLPRNLFVVGTMNTADRSIALIDSALRRRFYFRGLVPTQEPVSSVLPKWLERRGFDPEPADLLAALNKAIGDGEFSIGPSYFMTAGDPAAELEHVWEHALMPLLEEHFYGTTLDVRKEFGLGALRKQLSEQVAEQDRDGADPSSDDAAEDA